jgi:hypothetical protein
LIDRGLLGRILTHKAEVLAHLRAKGQELEIDRPAHADGWKPRSSAGAPAFSIIETCQSYGVALSIDENGDLPVGKTDQVDDLFLRQPASENNGDQYDICQ